MTGSDFWRLQRWTLTGYRYYETEQIDAMNYIQRLKRYGFSLDEIQKLLTLRMIEKCWSGLRQQKERLKQEQQEKEWIFS